MSLPEKVDALPRVMTPGMVAKIWHCSERHVRNMINSGELPSFRAGGKLIRLWGADVEAYERRSKAITGLATDAGSAVLSSPPDDDGPKPPTRRKTSARLDLRSYGKNGSGR